MLPASRAKRCRFALAWRGGTLRSHSGFAPEVEPRRARGSPWPQGRGIRAFTARGSRFGGSSVPYDGRYRPRRGISTEPLALQSHPLLNQNGVKREDAKIARVRAHRDMRALVAIRSAFHRYALRPTPPRVRGSFRLRGSCPRRGCRRGRRTPRGGGPFRDRADVNVLRSRGAHVMRITALRVTAVLPSSRSRGSRRAPEGFRPSSTPMARFSEP